MMVLITAGSTVVPIDRVRAISNIFKGRTGTAIAKYFAEQGAEVTLLTSEPGLLGGYHGPDISVMTYRDFDSLKFMMGAALEERALVGDKFNAVIHSAAVSDYKVEGVYAEEGDGLVSIENTGKIASNHEALFLKLVPTEKLIDLVRKEWGFRGTLVKFKLQVGISDLELLQIARQSRADSDADLIVANCLEWSGEYAYIVDRLGGAERVSRNELPKKLFESIGRADR